MPGHPCRTSTKSFREIISVATGLLVEPSGFWSLSARVWESGRPHQNFDISRPDSASGHRKRWARHCAQLVLPTPAIGARRLDKAAASSHSSPSGNAHSPMTASASVRRSTCHLSREQIRFSTFSAGHLGRMSDASNHWGEALRINPNYSIEYQRRVTPYKNPSNFEHIVGGLRKAGIS